MIHNYVDRERINKQLSIEQMFADWKQATNDYIRVGIFNPSTTCLDLEIALKNGLFKEDSKLILFENFEYIKNKKNYLGKLDFQKKIRALLPIIRPENFYFHFGDLEKLQLGAALATLNASKVNFMFIDLCGLLDKETTNWLLLNKPLIENDSFQYYTIAIQGAVRAKNFLNEELKVWSKKDKGVDPFHTHCFGIAKSFTDNEKEALLKWSFVCSHILNTTYQLDNVKNIVYNGGTSQKMGIFHGCNRTVNMSRWNYFSDMNFSPNRITFENDIDEFGINWKNARNRQRNFTKGEVSLFRDAKLPENMTTNKPLHLFNYLHKYRGNKTVIDNFHNISQIVTAMYGELYPPEYNLDRYRNSILNINRSKQIIYKYLLNKVISVGEEKYTLIETKNKYRYISINSPRQQELSFGN